MKLLNFLTILAVAVTIASASPFPDRDKYATALGVIERMYSPYMLVSVCILCLELVD